MIYFDHNATTPIDPRVLEVMHPFLGNLYGNASSLHRLGRVSRSAMDLARVQVAALVNVDPSQVIFTSGGTEANNLALHSANIKTPLAVSTIEHPSVMEVAETFFPPQLIQVNAQGLILQESIDALTLSPQSMVSIMLANNETGVIQALAAYTTVLKERGIIVHTDAVQAAGKIPIDFNQLGVELLSLSSHKLYGPKGVGALIVTQDVTINPTHKGGGQERNRRAGTENIAAIVGFGKAAELARIEMASRTQTMLTLRQALETELLTIPQLTLFSASVPRLPNTTQFSIANTSGEMLLMQLDQKNIAVSSGSACAVTDKKASPVLTAMGVHPTIAQGAVRISLGKDNTLDDIHYFIKTLKLLLS